MTRLLLAAALLASTSAVTGCRPARGQDSAEITAREDRFAKALAHPDSGEVGGSAIARWILPETLKEISGLALTADGRLLAHGDQRGKVFEIDYRRGVVIKEFGVGKPAVHADFEGITVVGDTVFLLASNGVLYQFPEGPNGADVQYIEHDTGLGTECEFEGVAYDPAIRSLLLACKNIHDKALKDSLVIFRWKLGPGSDTPSHLAIPLMQVVGANGWSHFHPSDITIDPFNGNYVLVASREKALVEVTPAGGVVFSRPLPSGHDQAEGVVITRDSILMFGDERVQGPAAITLYRWP